MSQQQQTILATIFEIHRNTYAPVRTVAVATRCYLSPAQMRRYLAAMEQDGVVRRVGMRKGWLPAVAA